jgi:CxxC motif-containing protein (DUF1111 family)
MNVTRAPRAPSLVTFGLLLVALLSTACGDGDSQDVAGPDAREQFPGGSTTNTLLLGTNAFKRAAANASAENEQAFYSGNSFFNSVWVRAPSSTTARDGLGPLFNARSCSGCHFADGRGRPPLAEDEEFGSMLLRIGTGERGLHGEPAPDPNYGDQLQPHGIDGVPGEGTPRLRTAIQSGSYADGTPYELLVPEYTIEDPAYGELSAELRISPRVAPIMIGLGLLEAIDEGRLRELADPDDQDGDGVSGRLNQVYSEGEYRIGRFGWKAEQPSLRMQSAGAFLGDIGITSQPFPDGECTEIEAECREANGGGAPEIDDLLLGRVETYSRLLAPPVRERWNDLRTVEGRRLFSDSGCASCHTPRHVTGDAELAELSRQVIYPYTDLLLHDMGEELSDARPAFDAEGNEWRTPPLWGIGRIPAVNGHDRLLHDGRARGVAEAVLWHGGEGEAAREAFRALSADKRAALVEFVESL